MNRAHRFKAVIFDAYGTLLRNDDLALIPKQIVADHGLSARDWANVAPRTIRLDELTTTRKELALDQLLDEDSTFYGDLFPHAVQWRGEIYLEDGLHRALRAALENRHTIHVRILDLDALKRSKQS